MEVFDYSEGTGRSKKLEIALAVGTVLIGAVIAGSHIAHKETPSPDQEDSPQNVPAISYYKGD